MTSKDTSKTTVEYIKKKAFWGDLYIARVYEAQKNTPGFAPETFDTHVCDIWVEYSDWNRRIYFKEANVEQMSTLEKIQEIFTEPIDKDKYEESTHD